MFSKRQNDIINHIAAAKHPIAGKTISSALHLSLRTIQNEIAAINRQNKLIRSSNKGYFIQAEDMVQLEREIITNDAHDFDFIKKLLFSDASWQIDELAEALYISTSTLEKRIREYRETLQHFHLHIERNKHHLSILGKEIDKRNFINYLILQEIEPAFYDLSSLNQYFPDTDILRIQQMVINALEHQHYHIDDIYFTNLLINIVIALYRMKTDNYIIEETENSFDIQSAEYRIAHEICHQYSNHWHIHPTENDIHYITSLLIGQIKPNQSQKQTAQPTAIDEAFLQSMDRILKETFEYYLLNIDYRDFLYNFALHINSLILRAKNKQYPHNEYLYTLKKSFPFVYDVSVKIAKEIADQYHISICDAEISLITIHIGYFMEHSLSQNNKVNVFLYCDEYHHIAENIRLQLIQHHSDFINIHKIADSTALNDPKLLHSNDLIITTKQLQMRGVRIILISPFYTVDDHIRVSDAIHELVKRKEQERLRHSFARCFDERLFFISDAFTDKYDIIRYLGNKLIHYGIVDESFIESAIRREQLSSTCFFDTFAIPHAITLNAKKTMFSVLISKKGIVWDDKTIHIVLMIAVQQKDRKAFMDIYESTVKILEEEERVRQIIASDCYKEFMRCLEGTS